MPKTELGLQATPNGVALFVVPEGQSPIAIDLPLPRACAVFLDFWKCLGNHYGKGETDATAAPPRMLDTGDFSVKIGGSSNGSVHLWIRPDQCAGIAYELTPLQTRELASQLLEAAEMMETYNAPKN